MVAEQEEGHEEEPAAGADERAEGAHDEAEDDQRRAGEKRHRGRWGGPASPLAVVGPSPAGFAALGVGIGVAFRPSGLRIRTRETA